MKTEVEMEPELEPATVETMAVQQQMPDSTCKSVSETRRHSSSGVVSECKVDMTRRSIRERYQEDSSVPEKQKTWRLHQNRRHISLIHARLLVHTDRCLE